MKRLADAGLAIPRKSFANVTSLIRLVAEAKGAEP
jgi:hypothetical protein